MENGSASPKPSCSSRKRSKTGDAVPRCRANFALPDACSVSAPRRRPKCWSDELYVRLIFEDEHHSIISLDMQELELECRR